MAAAGLVIAIGVAGGKALVSEREVFEAGLARESVPGNSTGLAMSQGNEKTLAASQASRSETCANARKALRYYRKANRMAEWFVSPAERSGSRKLKGDVNDATSTGATKGLSVPLKDLLSSLIQGLLTGAGTQPAKAPSAPALKHGSNSDSANVAENPECIAITEIATWGITIPATSRFSVRDAMSVSTAASRLVHARTAEDLQRVPIGAGARIATHTGSHTVSSGLLNWSGDARISPQDSAVSADQSLRSTSTDVNALHARKDGEPNARQCSALRRAVAHYRYWYGIWRERMGAGVHKGSTGQQEHPRAMSCPRARYLAKVARAKARAARRAYERWHHFHYAWWDWMPDKFQRIGACETGYGKRPGNFRWNSGTYQGFAGFYYGTWDAYKPRGAPLEAFLATPREQYECALNVYRAHGYGAWGCGGA